MGYEKETADAIVAGLITREYPHELTEKGWAAMRAKPVDWRARATAAEKQLAEVQQRLEKARKYADWLWGFWDGNTLISRSGYKDDIQLAFESLMAVLPGGDGE